MAADVDEMSHGLSIFGRMVVFKWRVSRIRQVSACARSGSFLGINRQGCENLAQIVLQGEKPRKGRNLEASFTARMQSEREATNPRS